MSTLQNMTREQFVKRLSNLCLRSGLSGMPKDEADQHILLKSAALLIGKQATYTEKEINERLQLWLLQVCQIKFFDHVTLRRWLVDAGYLLRSNNGTAYQLAAGGPHPEMFDASVEQIDPLETIRAAREEMERRKQAYLAKSQKA